MIRPEAYPFGTQYRCDTCRSHVTSAHVEGSIACHATRDERISSISY